MSFSCDYEALYYQYQVIDNSAWGKDKVYYFTFMVTDNSIPYDVTLDIRNSNKYPYQNLWLFCNEEPPVGPLQKDTIECMLADEFGNGTEVASRCMNPASQSARITGLPIPDNIHSVSVRVCVTA